MMMKPPYPPNFPPHCPPSGINNPQAIDFNDLAHYDTRIKQYIDEHDDQIKENSYTKSEIDNRFNGVPTKEEFLVFNSALTELSNEQATTKEAVKSLQDSTVRQEDLIHETSQSVTNVAVNVSANSARIEGLNTRLTTAESQLQDATKDVKEVKNTLEDNYLTSDQTRREISDLRAELLGLDVSDAYNSFREIQDHLKDQDRQIVNLTDGMRNCATKESVSELEVRVQDLEKNDHVTSAELTTILNGYATKSELYSATSDLSKQITDIATETARQDAKIQAAESNISKVEKSISDTVAELNKLEETVSSITSNSFDTYATKEALNQINSNLTSQIKVVATAVSKKASQENVNAISDRVTVLESQDHISEADVNEKISHLATKSELLETDLKLTTDVIANKTDIEHIKDDLSKAENILSTQTDAIYQNHLDIDAVKSDLNKYATKSYVDSLIGTGTGSNNVLFTNGEKVGISLGGFSAGDSVSGMTIKQILTKLLQISSVTPDVPDDPSEPDTPDFSETVQTIVDNKLPVYDLANDGTLVEKQFIENYWTVAEAKPDSTETCFYHIKNSSGDVIESGYQVNVALQQLDWLTVAIPDIITDFHVEQYDVMLGDWSIPNWTLVKTDKYEVPGNNVYTVPEQYQVASGITIRIVINN